MYVDPPPTTAIFIPLTPVSVTPSMKARWAMKNSAMTGAITIRVAPMVRFQFVWWALLKVPSP